jgi:hypothetical protein
MATATRTRPGRSTRPRDEREESANLADRLASAEVGFLDELIDLFGGAATFAISSLDAATFARSATIILPENRNGFYRYVLDPAAAL